MLIEEHTITLFTTRVVRETDAIGGVLRKKKK